MTEQEDNGAVMRWRLKEVEERVAEVKAELTEISKCLNKIKLDLVARGRWDRAWAAIIGGMAGALPTAIAAWAAMHQGS